MRAGARSDLGLTICDFAQTPDGCFAANFASEKSDRKSQIHQGHHFGVTPRLQEKNEYIYSIALDQENQVHDSLQGGRLLPPSPRTASLRTSKLAP